MEKLHSDHQKLLQQISSKDSMVEQLTNDVLHYKQKLQEKDNQVILLFLFHSVYTMVF